MTDAERKAVDMKYLFETDSPLRQAPSESEVEEFVADLQAHGQCEPIRVSPSDNGTYTVIDGRRRLRALRRRSERGERVGLVDVLVGQTATMRVNCADANMGRSLTPAEQAKNVAEIAQSAEAQSLRRSQLRDGRPAGPQHAPGLNAIVRGRYRMGKRSATKAIYRSHIPAEVLDEVMGTTHDRAELLTKVGKAAVHALEQGDDPVAAARQTLGAEGSASGERPRTRSLSARQLNRMEPAEVQRHGAEMAQEMDDDRLAALLKGLAEGRDAVNGSASEARDTVVAEPETRYRGAEPSPTGDPGPRYWTDGDHNTEDSKVGWDRRRGGRHHEGGPRGGTVEPERGDDVRERLKRAKADGSNLNNLQELTGVSRTTIWNVLNGRDPCQEVARQIERALPCAETDAVTYA